MKKEFLLVVGLASLITMGCDRSNKKNKDSEVISQRYIHKYGYDVSREEWESNNYPGQVITTKRNGTTVTATYEEGILHGALTQTYPHSLSPQLKQIYMHGHLVKKTSYDIRGVPTHEEEFLSPRNVRITSWYSKGTPLRTEEYEEDVLKEGSYFNAFNELESKVEQGFGTRIFRNPQGDLIFKDLIEEGRVARRETFYPSGVPNTSISYLNGRLHGEKKAFGPAGEPLSVENYENGHLNGISTYYQNGYKYREIPYLHGKRHGIERYFVDGENVIEELEWHEDMKHGPSVVYLDGYSRTDWYYNGDKVSKAKYHELLEREKVISTMHERSHRNSK